jgi:hypothetical protein
MKLNAFTVPGMVFCRWPRNLRNTLTTTLSGAQPRHDMRSLRKPTRTIKLSWEMRLAKAAAPAALTRLEAPAGSLQDLPLLPLAHLSQALLSIADLSYRSSQHLVCEIDRVPANLIEEFRPQIERSRMACDWQLRPRSRRKNQSRILSCPRELTGNETPCIPLMLSEYRCESGSSILRAPE